MSKPFDMYSWRRKYIYLAESDKQFPDYDPNKHKTLMRGAIDYDLEGDNIVAYLPFEEEAENAVRVVVPKAHLEQFLGDEIYDNEDLQAYDSDRIYDFFHNKWSGMFGKYDQMKDKMSESESMTEDAESVDEAYYEVLALIRQKARKLNDDDAYKFHELLKGFFNRLLQEDHTKDPSDKYTVKPCNMPGEPWAVWEGNKRIKGFETKEKAQAYADKENSEQRLNESKNKGIYFVRVSLRDALKAQRIIDDMYRNTSIMVRGEEFLSADPDLIQDLIMDFGTHDIEIEDDNLDFSDYDGHSDSDNMLDLYERYLKKY
jgi:hypothetical protein